MPWVRKKDTENAARRYPYGGTAENGLLQKKGAYMSDVKKYVAERKKRDPKFAEGYESGYNDFKIGALLCLEREKAGLTQAEIAKKLQTKKSAISRIENHAEDIRLSTLEKFVAALGRKLSIKIA